MKPLAPAVLIAVFALLTVPAILSGRGGTSEAFDQDRHHLVTIGTMVEQWPAVDLVNYRSATAPAYHLAMAGLTKLGAGLPTLRLANCLVGLALVLTIAHVAARLTSPWVAVAITMPIVLSPYLLGASIWLTTDNAALLWVVLAVGGAVTLAATPGRLVRWGLYTAIAVSIRQIHLWPVTAVALAAWLGKRPRAGLAAAAIGIAAPVTLVAVMLVAWQGFTPPGYQSQHASGVNPATFAFALGLAGVLGVFFLPAAWPQVRAVSRRDPWLWIAIAIALVVSLAVPTGYDKQLGRWGGWVWTLIQHLPTVAGRSLILVPMAVTGAVTLRLLTRGAVERGHGRSVVVLLVTILGFVVAQSANSQCFQRYLEIILLAALAWLAAMAADAGSRWWIGPLVLAGFEAALSVMTLYAPLLST